MGQTHDINQLISPIPVLIMAVSENLVNSLPSQDCGRHRRLQSLRSF